MRVDVQRPRVFGRRPSYTWAQQARQHAALGFHQEGLWHHISTDDSNCHRSQCDNLQ